MRILQHSSSFTQSGHWGSDGIIIPENEILKNIIQNSEGQIELNFTLLKLLITWINNGTCEGTSITAEDVAVMNKILLAVEAGYEQSINDFMSYQKEIKSLKNNIYDVIGVQDDREKNTLTIQYSNQKILDEIKNINERIDLLTNIIIIQKKVKSHNTWITKIFDILRGIRNSEKIKVERKANDSKTLMRNAELIIKEMKKRL